MALRQGRRSAAFVVATAIGLAALLGVVVTSPARAALTGFTVSPPQYSGQARLYVPTETMHIVLEGAPGDVFDLQVINFGIGTPFQNYENVTILASGQKTVDFTIPADWPDGLLAYRVAVYAADYFETGTGAPLRLPYIFSIQGYRLSVWTNRLAYLPGDGVSVSWSATMIKDGSAAPEATGEIQAIDLASGTSLLPTGNHTFAASQGSFLFSLSTAQAPDHDGRVYAWFNDTAAGRVGQDTADFYIGAFGLFVPASGASYAPGSILTATIHAEIVDAGGNPVGVGVPDAVLNVTVVDLGTGSTVAEYAASSLRTDAQGQVDYVVQLKDTPPSGSYEARAVGTAHGVLTANGAWQFGVATAVSFSISLTLDRTAYVSGETAHATATVYRSAPANYTFTWSVSDGVNRLAYFVGTASTFDCPIPGNFEGTLSFDVTVDDGNGNRLADDAQADVAFGYVTVSLDPSSFTAGDRIIASFSLSSLVITSPRYYVDVRDASGNLVASDNTTGTSFAYATPSPASSRYTFTVTASQGGWTARGSAMATELYLYTLQIILDRASYQAGETAHIHYRISPEGTAPQRAMYNFQISLGSIFAPLRTFSSTSPEGDVDVTIPAGASTGDVLLLMTETGTGAMALQTVHIGPTNPLLSEVAGLPVIDWFLTLLVVVLLLAVFFLWRRAGMGPGPKAPSAGRPTPPPPPPSGPAPPQAAGPMSVTCKHCGKPIEITMSKRPIEVMCPSCGETQVVQ